MDKWKYNVWILFDVMVVFLLVFLQQEYRYHFFFVEQNYMFQASWSYISSHVALPGGFSDLTGEFLMQYFMYPYAGAIITTLLLLLVAVFTNLILKRVNADYIWLMFAWIPALCLLFMHFDFNYNQGGTIAYLLMLVILWGAVSIEKYRWRLIYNLVAIGVIYWLCGSVFALYIFLILLFEFFKKKKTRYYSLLFIVLGGALGILSLRMALIGEYRLVFLPDQFYHKALLPKNHIYFSWISLVILFCLALLLKPVKEKKKLHLIAEVFLPLIFVLVFTVWGIREHGDEKSQKVKKLDYYSRTEQWDPIIKESSGSLSNYLYLCYLNRALAEKGELAENMFLYDQRGTDGLMLKWNRTFSISVLLSDLYFTIGNIAVAQEMAFESYISAMGGGNPRMLKRLIQTNLIYGEYLVAEKYIDLLEKTTYYKEWASDHRRFLFNDEEVEKDELLGEKRRCLVADSYLSNTFGVDKDLINIAKANPVNTTSVEYLGGLLLLSKDLESYKQFLDEYYGSEILPTLPVGFQEAVIILSENNPEEWKKYGVKQSIIDRFAQYKNSILANKNNQSLPQLMARDYANTYWFYFMFK